ncbi:MAG: hypothetical protein ACWA5P_05300 [bacterium]
MDSIINASLKTLNKSISILGALSNQQLRDNSVSPYYSSVGCHLRHVMDFYNCLFNGLEDKVIDLTSRERNELFECHCEIAIEHTQSIKEKLLQLKNREDSDLITVYDDLGLGKISMSYTLGSLLSQANSHAIHHYAIISYILDRLEIKIEDKEFGYNPSTPKNKALN